jgi:beta-phosphoglucomutase-like phosphatase (HAD superfamily)
MDGVLIDSLPAMEVAWNTCCKAYSLNIPFENYVYHVGKPFKDILTLLDIPDDLQSSVQTTYGLTATLSLSKVKPYKGIVYVLRRLRLAGITVGVVTSKEFWRADDIISSLLLPIDLLVTPEFTRNGKPSPDPLLYALGLCKVKAEQAVYFGDMRSDMESAIAARVAFAKANWGYGHFTFQGVCLDSPLDILDFLGV